MAIGVMFGEKHSFRDYGLILVSFKNPLPEAKRYLIDVPGRDGSVDLSEYLTGKTTFERRTLTFEFAFLEGYRYRYSQQRVIFNDIHGQEMKIILDDDPGYYYFGRILAEEWEVGDSQVATITVNVDADPYKYDVLSSLDDWLWDPFSFVDGIIRQYKNLTVSGTLSLTIPGSTMPVVPIITASTAMSVSFNGKTYSLSKGDNKIYDIYLINTDNVLTFKGNGTVSIDYRGGSF